MTYAGILAPAAKRRRQVVPRPSPQIRLVFPVENMRPEARSATRCNAQSLPHRERPKPAKERSVDLL